MASKQTRIPFFKPALPPWARIEPALRSIHDSGILTSGRYVQQFEERLAEMLGVKHVIACANATLGMTLMLDTLPCTVHLRVAIPGFTFAATQQAVEWTRCFWRWVDVGEDCNIEMRQKDYRSIGAILAVHISGNPCDCALLERMTRKHKIKLFFDAAHALGSTLGGRAVANYGDASVLSLGVTKIIAAGGEGGAVVTNDDAIAEHVRLAVNHGRRAGSMDVEIRGTNARMQEYSAAYALAMLPELPQLVARRNAIRGKYVEGFNGCDCIAFPPLREGAVASWKDISIFVNLEDSTCTMPELFNTLKQRGVSVRRYYWPPAHMTKWMRSCRSPSLPVTERLASRVVSLPAYPSLTNAEIDYVIETVRRTIKA